MSFDFCARKPNETINDANDRAIRTCAKYFKSLLSLLHSVDSGSVDNISCGNQVLLITNDKANINLASSEDILVMSIQGYISSYLSDYPEIFDLLAADLKCNTNDVVEHSKLLFHQHLSTKDLLNGLKSRRLLKGTIRS